MSTEYQISKDVVLGSMKGGENDGMNASNSDLNSNSSSSNLNATATEDEHIQWPFFISVASGGEVNVDDVQAYLWDEPTQRWSQEGIFDLKTENGVCSLRTVHFKPFIIAKVMRHFE